MGSGSVLTNKINEAQRRVLARKAELGSRLVILTHHYQRAEVVDVGDHRGDSLGLSSIAAGLDEASYIVFCGVHFMAESAELLSRDEQKVYHPDLRAGCPMADMADLEEVEAAWEELGRIITAEELLPVTYINSHAELKAFCGRHGGAICTSSNARTVLQWALEQRPRALFFPDQHLGRNTANALGLPKEEQIVWNPRLANGGNEPEAVRRARIVLWNGHCHVHTHFMVEDVEKARERHPDVIVIVHPECTEEVVARADESGSTGFIVDFVTRAPAGSRIGIGTEVNLVTRLARDNPDKTVFPLSPSVCPNMWKIDLVDLCETVENLDSDRNVIHVDDAIKEGARLALNRMLQLR